ncbi:MAG: DUF4262 domain-containing protein [Crocinitomicaceae bacterium]|nr:DUF4262 domain-containing protein [Crocinitomicaceae bacterium]
MELCKFSNGIEDHNMIIDTAIKSDGIYIKREESYSYTVGFNNIGSPELVIFNTSPDAACEIFHTLYLAARNTDITLVENKTISTLFAHPLFLETYSEFDTRKTIFGARTYYGNWEFDVLKIMISDNVGGF